MQRNFQRLLTCSQEHTFRSSVDPSSGYMQDQAFAACGCVLVFTPRKFSYLANTIERCRPRLGCEHLASAWAWGNAPNSPEDCTIMGGRPGGRQVSSSHLLRYPCCHTAQVSSQGSRWPMSARPAYWQDVLAWCAGEQDDISCDVHSSLRATSWHFSSKAQVCQIMHQATVLPRPVASASGRFLRLSYFTSFPWCTLHARTAPMTTSRA